MVPGFDDTMRVNGIATISRDPDMLGLMAVQDRQPTVCIVVTVSEVFIHCAKAFRRSKLWDPTRIQDRRKMPSLINIIPDRTTGAPEDPDELSTLDEGLEDEYRKTMS